jgi:hypothetical protein
VIIGTCLATESPEKAATAGIALARFVERCGKCGRGGFAG